MVVQLQVSIYDENLLHQNKSEKERRTSILPTLITEYDWGMRSIIHGVLVTREALPRFFRVERSSLEVE